MNQRTSPGAHDPGPFVLDDTTPIYVQVADHVRGEILSGGLAAGDRVMSTNEYAEFLRINPATAAKGLSLLVEDGVLYKRRGLGMFVTDDARERLLRDRRESLLTERIDQLVAEARLLDIPLDEFLDHVRSRARDHQPRPSSPP